MRIRENRKKLSKIEKELRTCPVSIFGKTQWKRKQKRDRLIEKKITLQNSKANLRRLISGSDV